jgi:hypothetical protein
MKSTISCDGIGEKSCVAGQLSVTHFPAMSYDPLRKIPCGVGMNLRCRHAERSTFSR